MRYKREYQLDLWPMRSYAALVSAAVHPPAAIVGNARVGGVDSPGVEAGPIPGAQIITLDDRTPITGWFDLGGM